MSVASLLMAFCLLSACATSGQPSSTISEPAPIRATLTRQPGNVWLLDYDFPVPGREWRLVRTNPSFDGASWRAASWMVETPGVTLEQRDGHDVLVSEQPISAVRVRVASYSEPLRADNTPFVPFTDGGVAVYSDHYAIEPLTAQSSTDGAAGSTSDTRLTVRLPEGRLLLDGMPHSGEVSLLLAEREAYIYAGPGRLIEGPAFAAVVDPRLPGWIREELEGFVPRLLTLYRQRLGAPSVAQPSIFAAWGGAGRRRFSLGGSVLDGMIVLNLEGVDADAPTTANLQRLRMFLAHEAAHFWLGHTLRLKDRADNWITEGGAELIAIRGLGVLIPGYDSDAAIARMTAECVAEVGPGEPLRGATQRGDLRAPYACGATLLADLEHRASGKDAFDVVRELVASYRGNRGISADEWLAYYERETRGGDFAREVRLFVLAGLPYPRVFTGQLSDAGRR